MKRGRMGQIAASEMAGYYGFTTIGDVNTESVEMNIFKEKLLQNLTDFTTVF